MRGGKNCRQGLLFTFFPTLSLTLASTAVSRVKRKMRGFYMEMIFVLSHYIAAVQQVMYTHFNINSATYKDMRGKILCCIYTHPYI